MESQCWQWKIKSKIGPLFLVASKKGLRGVFWNLQKESPLLKKLQDDFAEERILKQAATELEEYFAGQRKKFDVPLDADGTEFQKRVWKELSKIPYGCTVSYLDVAKKINPKAVRAVGTANGKNPLGIIVPCHRVIASDGSLGGYSGGLKIKMQLLELEKLAVRK